MGAKSLMKGENHSAELGAQNIKNFPTLILQRSRRVAVVWESIKSKKSILKLSHSNKLTNQIFGLIVPPMDLLSEHEKAWVYLSENPWATLAFIDENEICQNTQAPPQAVQSCEALNSPKLLSDFN